MVDTFYLKNVSSTSCCCFFLFSRTRKRFDKFLFQLKIFRLWSWIAILGWNLVLFSLWKKIQQNRVNVKRYNANSYIICTCASTSTTVLNVCTHDMHILLGEKHWKIHINLHMNTEISYIVCMYMYFFWPCSQG